MKAERIYQLGEKLNKLVDDYKSNPDSETFESIYHVFITMYDHLFYTIANKIDSDYYEARAKCEDLFLKLLKRHKIGDNFAGKCNVSIRNRSKDWKRDYYRNASIETPMEIKHQKYETLQVNIIELDQELETLEEKYFSKLEKRNHIEKSKLVNDLLNKNTDRDTNKIMREYMEVIPETGKFKHKSLSQVGKYLKIHRETVSRKVKRVAKLYDEETYGDIDSYLK